MLSAAKMWSNSSFYTLLPGLQVFQKRFLCWLKSSTQPEQPFHSEAYAREKHRPMFTKRHMLCSEQHQACSSSLETTQTSLNNKTNCGVFLSGIPYSNEKRVSTTYDNTDESHRRYDWQKRIQNSKIGKTESRWQNSTVATFPGAPATGRQEGGCRGC